MEAKKKATLLLYPLVLVAVAAAYFSSLGNGFVFDDRLLILEDPGAYGAERLAGHFTGEEGFHKTMGRYYRPLVAVTYAIDKAVAEALGDRSGAGQDALDPLPFHVTNVIIHAVASLLLLRLLLLLFGAGAGGAPAAGARAGGMAAALIGALLYAVHPVHTEAVSWISGRTDSLACLFYVAALAGYVRFSREGRGASIKWVFLFLAAALLCKEMAVTFVAAALLFDLTLGRGGAASPKARAAVLAGLAAVTLLFLGAREIALSHVPGGGSYDYFHGRGAAVTVATMAQTLPVYARLLVWPVDLLYHYNGALPFRDSFAEGAVLVALGFVAVTLAAAIGFRRRSPATSFAIVFFYLALTPVLNLVPTMTLMAERFLAIPSIALSLIAAELISTRRTIASRVATAVALGAAVVLLGIMTDARSRVWEDNETLYLSADGNPGTVINVNLGNRLARLGELARAEVYYFKALDARENTLPAHLNLGALFLQRGKSSADAAKQREGWGDRAGAIQLRDLAENEFDTARIHLDRALALDPASADTLYTLAALCEKRGAVGECIRFLERLQEVSPGYLGTDALLVKMRSR